MTDETGTLIVNNKQNQYKFNYGKDEVNEPLIENNYLKAWRKNKSENEQSNREDISTGGYGCLIVVSIMTLVVWACLLFTFFKYH
jgi:hypothetical protein